jgi:quercetin dioxygenase-like cupin family protein
MPKKHLKDIDVPVQEENPMERVAKWEQKLIDEGFHNIYGWQDKPNEFYSDHRHPYMSTHVILDGEMFLTMGGKTQKLGAGARTDVPANTIHSAKMGPKGCVYIVGEKQSKEV